MIEKIKNLIKHSAIYSLSNITIKAAGIILIPLYTINFTQREFGIWDLIDVSIAIVFSIMVLGQSNSIMMFNNSKEYKGKEKQSFFTITAFLSLLSLILIGISELIYHFKLFFTGSNEIYLTYIRISSFVVFLRVINSAFLSKLRADEKSAAFGASNLFRLIVNVVFIIYFVSFKKLGVLGVIYGYLISEAALFIILIIPMLKQMTFRFSFPILKIALAFGMPLVLSGLGFQILNLSDRYLIKIILTENSLAVYGLSYRIAGLLNMMLVLPINLILLPIAFKYYQQPGDKRFFSKLMTYSTFMSVWLAIGISLFGKEIITILAPKPEYQSALLLIPIILFGYVLSGMRMVGSLGLYLTKNTKKIAILTIIAAVINIILNVIFIPRYGIYAAAVNTFISFFVFYLLTQSYSGKFYKIPFENIKLTKVFLLGLIFSFIPLIFLKEISVINVIFKFLLLIIFPVLLYFWKFYESIELEYIKKIKNLDSVKKALSEIIKK